MKNKILTIVITDGFFLAFAFLLPSFAAEEQKIIKAKIAEQIIKEKVDKKFKLSWK